MILGRALRGFPCARQVGDSLSHGLKRQSATQKRRKTQEHEWDGQGQECEERKAGGSGLLDLEDA